MDLNDIDPSQIEFSDKELDALADILVKAQKIQEDTTLHRLVMKHADKKVKDFKSIDDLKQHKKNLEKEADSPDEDEIDGNKK